MKRSIILPCLVTAFVALSPAGVALADPAHNGGDNTGTGQPNQEANLTAGSSPPGFLTGLPGGRAPVGSGFANAEGKYANPDSTGGMASGNTHVVSQYDVAGHLFCTHRGTPCG